MRRLVSLLALPVAAGVLFAQAKTADPPKKEEPKKKIAFADPKDVKDDADFAVQGEYEGSVTLDREKQKDGAQVVAKGGGKFAVKLLRGGLPGAGWNEKDVKNGSAELKDGKVSVTIKERDQEITGTIDKGEMTLTKGDVKLSLKKVERKSPTLGAEPPKGAVVLFAKEGDEKNWSGGKVVELSDGKVLNNGITTKQEFKTPYTLHVEFRLPWMPNSTGQGRGNSGVYLQDRFELQVLDSFGLKGENNECGGLYTLHKPKVNMCLPPLVWQTYDVDFTPADVEGKKITKPARITVKHNGVIVHEDAELPRRTDGVEERGNPWAIQLQYHGDPVVYRNVWVAEKK